MTGYVPLFQSLTTGTLCGRWPDVGLWPIVLSLADRHGVVDVTPAYLSGVTGLPVDDVVACMARFCSPDPYSRTPDADGARLQLIDTHRDWGWVVVNHSKYRERARLQAKDSARTISGQDAARKRADRAESDDVPRCPPDSPSQTQTKQYKEEEMSSSSTMLVFDHWKNVFKHPKAILDSKRKRTIREALKLFTAEDIRNALTGYCNSAWHMGANDRKQVYDSIDLLLRDAKHIEDGLKLFSQPPAGNDLPAEFRGMKWT